VLASCLALGFAWAGGRSTVRLADELAFADEGRDVRVEGIIASLPMALDRGVRFEFDIEQVLAPDVKLPSRVLLAWYSLGLDVQPGERWQFTVRLRRPHGVLNPGGFDLEAWLLERNLRATGYVRTAAPPTQLSAARPWRAVYAIERSRAMLRDRLAPMLADHRYGGVIQALILGDQRAIAAADWTLFNRTAFHTS
jgi:competence protein ComEC